MFNKLKALVEARFKEMLKSGEPLFYVEIDRDLIWEKYLSGFNDPVERQHHNCNCCKSFLRQYSGIVTIEGNRVRTLWNIDPPVAFLQSVKNVHNYIMSLPVTDVFVNDVAQLGTDKNFSEKHQLYWTHFFLSLPQKFVKAKDDIPSMLGNLRDNKNVWKRSLEELTIDAVDTVLELIAQDSLYRGKESEQLLKQFQAYQRQYKATPVKLRDNYAWISSTHINQGLARIRNTAMGTLLVDLSKPDRDLDKAVGAFEDMMSSGSYKRPQSVATPRQIEAAKDGLRDAGYLESLERRFAVATDLNVNNLLFVDRTTNLSDIFEDMKKDAVVSPKSLTKVEDIAITSFIEDVLPKTKGLYALLENNHLRNMATLLTAANGAPTLFKWGNPFSWAYTGGITDSIKERVKQAGGKIDGELRTSLSWHNFDDLDLHIIEPNGNRIYFGDSRSRTSDGTLDVDMNARGTFSRSAVENIVFTDPRAMQEGKYEVIVHNYCQRDTTTGLGFEVQIECRGETFDLGFTANPRNNAYQTVASFVYTRKDGLKMLGDVKSSVADKEKWNLKTNRFHKVKHMLLSPNCWDGDMGNKHFFFMLENCASDEQTRPFFNEFLKSELNQYRKFFELLGSRMAISPTTKQIAGLGFSETQRNHLIVKVEGAFKRTLKINF